MFLKSLMMSKHAYGYISFHFASICSKQAHAILRGIFIYLLSQLATPIIDFVASERSVYLIYETSWAPGVRMLG